MGINIQNRVRQGFDVNQILLVEQTFVGSIVTGSGINVGENIELDIVAICRGARGNADNALIFTVQESHDNSTFVDAEIMVNLTDSVLKREIMIRTTRKWVRVVSTAVSGTTPSFADTEVYIRS